MTHKRVVAVVISFWVFSVIACFWYESISVLSVMSVVCIITTGLLYCMIYTAVRHHTNQNSRSASTWTISSEWRHGKCRKAEKNCRCYILHVYFVFYFSYLQFVKKYIYINSCNAKLRRQHRRTVKNNNRSNHEQKSNFARAAHFFVHFFAVVLHDYNVKPSQTS